MSEYSSGMTLTDVGQALQVKKLASTEALEITKAVYGDGKIADGTDIKALTAMVSQKMTLPMVSSKVVGNGTAEISLLQDNSGVEAPGFPITEIGVYAKDGEAEILYSYAYFGDHLQSDEIRYCHRAHDSADSQREIRFGIHTIGRFPGASCRCQRTYGTAALRGRL